MSDSKIIFQIEKVLADAELLAKHGSSQRALELVEIAANAINLIQSDMLRLDCIQRLLTTASQMKGATVQQIEAASS